MLYYLVLIFIVLYIPNCSKLIYSVIYYKLVRYHNKLTRIRVNRDYVYRLLS